MSIKTRKILSGVIFLLNLCAFACICFPFFKGYDFFGRSDNIYGFELYTSIWYWILLSVLGIICFLYDSLILALYIIEENKENLINKMTRYGAFYGALIAIINFVILQSISQMQNVQLAFNLYIVILIGIIVIKILLLFLKTKTESIPIKRAN